MITRSFLPVGQGAFYVEKFKSGESYVYDCGTASGINKIVREIEQNFNCGETIEGVFISHLHNDHVNGLEKLLQHCDVRKVFLPYLTPQEIALTYASGECGVYESSEFVQNLLENPVATIREASAQKDTEIIRITPQGEQQVFDGDGTLDSGYEIGASTKVTHGVEWVYIPFNFRNTTRTQQFLEHLSAKKIDPEDFNDICVFKEKWGNSDGNYRKALTEAYKSFKVNLNTNSLVVYSGVKDATSKLSWCIQKSKNYVHDFCWCQCYYKPGCLYLGDYELSGKTNWNELMCNSKIANFIEQIGMIQVPHHGSRLSHNPNIADFNSVFIISAGSCTRYRHPSVEVVKDILKKDRKLLIINEDEDALACFEVSLC